MDSAKKIKIKNETTQENIYINIGKSKIEKVRKKIKIKWVNVQWNKIKCAIQSTVDLINININRDVQEEYAKQVVPGMYT